MAYKARAPAVRRAPLKKSPYTRTPAGAAAPCVAGGLVSPSTNLAIFLPWGRGGAAGAFCPFSIEPVALSLVAVIKGGVGGGGRARAMARAGRCPRAGLRPVSLGRRARLLLGALYSSHYTGVALF